MNWHRAKSLLGMASISIILQACHASSPAPRQEPMRIGGFSTPESVLYDEQHDVYLVSNINGSPIDKDDNGFISRVSPDGRVLEAKWIDGASPGVTLNAPKGLALSGGKLYVADIDVVRVFDAEDGTPAFEVPVPGATFLNDITVMPDGSAVVSDSGLTLKDGNFAPTGTDALIRIDSSGRVTKLAAGAAMDRPNGVLWADDTLWLVTFGSNKLVGYDGMGQKRQEITLPAGQLDGIVHVGAHELLVSSWDAAAVFHVDVGQGSSPRIVKLAGDLKSPADIGFDAKRHRLLVPLFSENAVACLDAEP